MQSECEVQKSQLIHLENVGIVFLVAE